MMGKSAVSGQQSAVGRRDLLAVAVLCAVTGAVARAAPTQEEVFRSIGQNVDQPVDSGKVLAVLAGAAGVIILLALVGHRRREGGPKPASDNPGKLLKEVLRTVPVKPVELKQLRLLVQERRTAGGPDAVDSPLTLLLCPSLLARTANEHPQKVNKKVLAGLVRKLVGRR